MWSWILSKGRDDNPILFPRYVYCPRTVCERAAPPFVTFDTFDEVMQLHWLMSGASSLFR